MDYSKSPQSLTEATIMLRNLQLMQPLYYYHSFGHDILLVITMFVLKVISEMWEYDNRAKKKFHKTLKQGQGGFKQGL